ncbi:DUF1707 SHOCT-like domain-containing protein [Jidongwangia harbinensis]|uniref:DUF1707 SHOCT-like domain-containing protein n=1 Tax=Jidongwangia harbinensis TaxID=2878561 RepID=UPI001CD94958|nr:DUF1707 domain-containing protein [Jidongwangia harbinensis]MCA2218962.1 DUF1707 domain-containing protein [Jidongwangia harbinensis]
MRDQRVGSTDRAEVIGLLGRALEKGHLTLPEHDARVVAVGTATYASELLDQLSDLPPEYAWLPAAAIAPAPGPAGPGSSGRAALVLGILSLPTSFCVLGGLLGAVAVVLSLRGPRRPGWGPALIGRVLGLVGIALSSVALVALVLALGGDTGP